MGGIFVSNSSSSSFIVLLKNSKLSKKEIQEHNKKFEFENKYTIDGIKMILCDGSIDQGDEGF